METPNLPAIRALRPAWNKGRIVGQKRPFKPKHVWAIRVRLELAENHRDLALFNLAIDSKLRGCDLVKMTVVDVMASGQIKERASVLQSKTQKSVRFEISEGTRAALDRWMQEQLMIGSEYLWPGRFHERLHISTRQYARIVRDWVTSIGLEASAYGMHSMRRTKVTQIYKTGTYARSSSCWAIRKWTVRSDIWESSLRMLSKSQRRSKSKRFGPSSGTAQSSRATRSVVLQCSFRIAAFPTADAVFQGKPSTSRSVSEIFSVDQVSSRGGVGGVSQVRRWMLTFATKFAEIGAVTNRNAMINSSCIDASPKTIDWIIEAKSSMPIPTVPTFVGAWSLVIGSLNFRSPPTPTRTNPDPISRQSETA